MSGVKIRQFEMCLGESSNSSLLLFQLNEDECKQDLPELFLTLDARERREVLLRSGVERTRYVLTHGMLRKILGTALHIPPEDIVYVRNSYGKPALKSGGLNFNMSHSDSLCIIGISYVNSIGVDIQRHVFIEDMWGIAANILSSVEYQLLYNTPVSHQKAEFFNMWTRKEALLKCIGTGLANGQMLYSILPHGKHRAIAIHECQGELPVKISYGVVGSSFSWGVALGSP